MDSIRLYVINVIVSALVCTLMELFVGAQKDNCRAVRFVLGVFLAVMLLHPLIDGIQVPYLDLDNISLACNEATAVGEMFARDNTEKYISDGVEAYIIEKAEQVGVQMRVEVELSEVAPYCPETVTIIADASPYNKRILSAMIENELGIPEDDQVWI